MVFCSRYKSDDDAIQMLTDNVEGKPLNDPRVIKFRTGTRRKHWNKNCIAMGLSSGFIEPLESTSIHFIQRSITRLMQMFPFDGIRQPDVEEFNRQMDNEMTHTRDFIILHYHVTNRTDTPFWRFCKSMDIPDSLKHRIELFKQTGRVFKNPTELFGENSWTQVMLGQGLMPEQYHPIVNMMSDEELKVFLDTIEERVAKQLQNMPKHNDFIQHYCRSA
jgi:tryptophan halogenase